MLFLYWLLLISAGISASAFSLIWWERVQMPYTDTGKHYDGLVVWGEHGVEVYAFLAVFFWLFTLFVLWRIARKKG